MDRYLVDLSKLVPWNHEVPSAPGQYAIVILHEKIIVKGQPATAKTAEKQDPKPSTNQETTTEPRKVGRPPKAKSIDDIYKEVSASADDSPEDDLESIVLSEKPKTSSAVDISAENIEGEFYTVISVNGSVFHRKHSSEEKALKNVAKCEPLKTSKISDVMTTLNTSEYYVKVK